MEVSRVDEQNQCAKLSDLLMHANTQIWSALSSQDI